MMAFLLILHEGVGIARESLSRSGVGGVMASRLSFSVPSRRRSANFVTPSWVVEDRPAAASRALVAVLFEF